MKIFLVSIFLTMTIQATSGAWFCFPAKCKEKCRINNGKMTCELKCDVMCRQKR